MHLHSCEHRKHDGIFSASPVFEVLLEEKNWPPSEPGALSQFAKLKGHLFCPEIEHQRKGCVLRMGVLLTDVYIVICFCFQYGRQLVLSHKFLLDAYR